MLNVRIWHTQGCGAARFCSFHYQKMASSTGIQDSCTVWTERHKDICGVLRKMRQVEKHRMTAESCIPDMLAFRGQASDMKKDLE
jgi:hypothetical protein